MIVVDASVLAVALIDGGDVGERLRTRLRDEVLLAPGIVDLEVASVWRREVRASRLSAERAAIAVSDLGDLPMERIVMTTLLWRCWQLRDDLNVYDTAYVAVAESFDAVLVTGDGRLARSPGVRCRIELLTTR